jgi:hypothetical protein
MDRCFLEEENSALKLKMTDPERQRRRNVLPTVTKE